MQGDRMIQEIQDEVLRRGITRLCHFTPSRNLLHIAAGKKGILATANLEAIERDVYNPTDIQRLDGHRGHICCSIEFPNIYYLDQCRIKEPLFEGWVVLLIRKDYLWQEGTLFCPRNAASGMGGNLTHGQDGFRSLFSDQVGGAQGRVFTRFQGQLECCTTDVQAEVLVADRIDISDILAVGVRTEQQAEQERIRMKVCQIDPDLFSFRIAPALFDRTLLLKELNMGRRPKERVWDTASIF
jgi:hypothetical protein